MSALEWLVLIALFAVMGALLAAIRAETQRQAEMNRTILLRLEENIQSLHDRLIGIEQTRAQAHDSESDRPDAQLSDEWPFKR